MTQNKLKRNRLIYFIASCLVVPIGLASRRGGPTLPSVINDYGGDTLWALMAFLTVAFIAPRWSSCRIALTAFGLSVAVELSQLYHAPWIDDLRHTALGGLILGYGFLWSDLVCYVVGISVGFVLDKLLTKIF